MDKVIVFLTALVRFLWPFANARTREVVGTIVMVLTLALSVAVAYYQPDASPAVPTPVPAAVFPVEVHDADVPAVEDSAPVQIGKVILGVVLPVGCAGPLNATQLKYATIGKDTASDLFNLCGLKWAEGAMEGNGIAKGTANGDEALACLTRVAVARGLQVIVEVAQDVVTGATGGGWFGTSEVANQHMTIYTVRVVRAVQ